MLELLGIGRRFGDQFALEHISLQVEPGNYWVILCPSGSGKSLLLHLIAGLHRPDAGTVLLDGRDLTDTAPEQRGFGLVFQQSALFPHYSVRGNIEYGLRARGLSDGERQRRVDELVQTVKLEGIVDRPVATLSGGEAQKVALARALAIRPKMLLLDEPLSPIDHNARLELQEELGRIHRELELTTLHVTHSRDEARALGDHCAVMFNGSVVQAGAVDDVFASPRCRYVARFLGGDENSVQQQPAGCHEECLRPGGLCERPEGWEVPGPEGER